MATNPFRFGALALDEAFTDRVQEVRQLRADIINGQDVVIVGPRRFGKSSLVLRVTQELKARRVLVAYCDLSTTPTKERFAEKLAKAIYDDVASPLFRARERTLEVFRGLRITPRITIDPHDGSVSFGFDVGHAPADVDATLESLLALPGRPGSSRPTSDASTGSRQRRTFRKRSRASPPASSSNDSSAAPTRSASPSWRSGSRASRSSYGQRCERGWRS